VTPPPSPGRVTAIVLAGGRSQRFAPDKLAELVDGQPLLDLTLSAVPADFSVVLVGPPRPTMRPVELAREEPPGGGPAAALVTGLTYALSQSAEALVVLPGDAPLAGTGAVVLLERLLADPAIEAVVAVDDSGQLQPLQLALSAAAARSLVQLAGPDGAANASARALVARLQPPAVTCRLPPDCLLDVDTPEALRRLQS
jgi:molybdenum cofactor guanylyltransferase